MRILEHSKGEKTRAVIKWVPATRPIESNDLPLALGRMTTSMDGVYEI